MLEKLERMTFHLLKAKLSWKTLISLRNKLILLAGPTRELFASTLDDIELYEFREVLEIWDLLPEIQWNNYELLGITDLREQVMLEKALSNLKRAVTERLVNYGEAEESRKAGGPQDPAGVCAES